MEDAIADRLPDAAKGEGAESGIVDEAEAREADGAADSRER
jgi:hypothetical protein